jgi:hypothetical protein
VSWSPHKASLLGFSNLLTPSSQGPGFLHAIYQRLYREP